MWRTIIKWIDWSKCCMCENLRENILEIRILYLYIQGRIYTSLIYLHELEIVVQDYMAVHTLCRFICTILLWFPVNSQGLVTNFLSSYFLLYMSRAVFDHPNNDVFYSFWLSESKKTVTIEPQWSMFFIYFCIVYQVLQTCRNWLK